ncbi:MAG: DoxX [Acidimicrobiales bacterium]|nr:DoxX [Acidimicrobiales bacterium]
MATVPPPVQQSRAQAWLAALVSTRQADVPVAGALVAVRIALAWIFFWYGSGKLFGWFDGPGIHETARFFSNTAHLHPGGFFAVVGGVIEFGGAIAIAVGLGTRVAGVALFVDMVVAMITVTWSRGIDSEKVPPGYEFNLALAALALVVVLLGAGRFSLDALAERALSHRPKALAPNDSTSRLGPTSEEDC